MSADISDVYSGASLREIRLGMAKRLLTVDVKFYDAAIKLVDEGAVTEGATAAGVSMKAGEHLRQLLGLNMPSQHAVALEVQASRPQKTSTDRIAEVIERLCLEGNSQASPDEDDLKPN